MLDLKNPKAQKMWQKAWLWPFVLVLAVIVVTGILAFRLNLESAVIITSLCLSFVTIGLAESAVRALRRYGEEDGTSSEVTGSVALHSLSLLDLIIAFLSPLYVIWICVTALTVIIVPPRARYMTQKMGEAQPGTRMQARFAKSRLRSSVS